MSYMSDRKEVLVFAERPPPSRWQVGDYAKTRLWDGTIRTGVVVATSYDSPQAVLLQGDSEKLWYATPEELGRDELAPLRPHPRCSRCGGTGQEP